MTRGPNEAIEVLLECHASEIDVRVNVGVGVMIIKTSEGRVIVSTAQAMLEELMLRIRLALDSAESHAPGRRSEPSDGSDPA